MNDNETNVAEQEAPEVKKKPSHYAYQVKEVEGGNAFFNRIGSAFAHKDGEGFNLILDSVPVDGRVTLRTPKERLQDLKEGKVQRGKGVREPER